MLEAVDGLNIETKFPNLLRQLFINGAVYFTTVFNEEQVLIDTVLPQTADKLLNICLKLYKGVMSFRNKSIQDNLLKADRPRGAPAHKQEYLYSQKEKIKDLLKRGISVLQISKSLNCSYTTLYRYLKNHPEFKDA